MSPQPERHGPLIAATANQVGHDSAQAPQGPAALFEERVLEAARESYDPRLAYHHFGHALRAVDAGERLMTACTAAGVGIEPDVVRLALLFHDAGYGTDPGSAGCESPEAYSAALARRALAGHVPEPLLAKVEAAILATRQSAVPDTAEGQVVRAADLAELAADFDTYKDNSEALRTEVQYMAAAPVPDEQWGACCATV